RLVRRAVDHGIMRGRVHGLLLLAGPGLAYAVAVRAGCLDERGLDPALRWLRHALDERPIGLRCRAGLEDAAELGGGGAVLGDEQHAGRVAVEAVHEARAVAEAVGHAGEDAVDVATRARAALDRDAERFVEDQHIDRKSTRL